MGDFTDIQTLALVSRCSKKAHTALTPLCNIKMESKQERDKLFFKLFRGKTICSLKENEKAVYYSMLLNRYFVTPYNVPHQFEVTQWVGVALDGYADNLYTAEHAVRYVMKAMKSAQGRRRILVAIDEWNAVLTPSPMSRESADKVRVLDRLYFNVLDDFCCRSGKIHTNFYKK
jgi:hypothetical protein